jgi:hypothetical protein
MNDRAIVATFEGEFSDVSDVRRRHAWWAGGGIHSTAPHSFAK